MERQRDFFKENEITDRLNTKWMARKTIFLKSTVSTNLDAGKLLDEGGANGTLVVADEQTGGKGRRGRSWVSPPGEAVYMSLALKLDFEPDKASMLTIVMAYAVATALRKVTGLDAGIKWPNDIVVKGRKLCGILTEMNMDGGRIRNVVIGIGINVNQCAFDDEIKETATSVFVEKGQKTDRSVLIGAIMDCFEGLYEQFVKEQDLGFLCDEYNEMLVNRDRHVRVLDPGEEYEGIALGINTAGELIVRKEDASEVCVYAGEVSVRGVYGYV